MHKLTKVILTGLCLSAPAFCQDTVPHTFKPNTPAKAAEVNQNFQTVMQKANEADAKADANASELVKVKQDVATLDAGGSPGLDDLRADVESLDSRVTALHNGGGDSEAADPRQITVTYEAKSVEVGSTQKIGQSDCMILKVPVVDLESGDEYIIQFPAILDGDNTIYPGLACKFFPPETHLPQSISGYPAQVSHEWWRYISMSIPISSDATARSHLEVEVRLELKIGGTLVSITVAMPKSITGVEPSFSDEFSTSFSQGDLVKAFDHKEMNTGFKVNVEGFMDDFVDYIKIEQVSE